MTKRLLTLALLLSSAAASALAQGTPAPASVAGAWKVTGDIMGYPVDMTCTFAQDGKKLTGACQSAGESKATEIAGEVDEKKVTWSLKTQYQGQEITVTFKGALDEASAFKGDIDVQPLGVGGIFSAKKEEAKKEETGKPQQ
jgi:hypothetical protein